MQIYSVSDVLKGGPGTLTGLKGKIKTIGDWNEGEGKKGHWSKQTCVIQDITNPRAEILVKIWNRDVLDKRERGNVIWFTAGAGKKNGDPVGLKAEEDTYRNKTSLIVSFNEEAEWGFSDPGQGLQRSSAPQKQNEPTSELITRDARQHAPPQPASQPPPPESAPAPRQKTREEWELECEQGRKDAVKKAKAFLAQQANLMLLCIEAADYICNEYETIHVGVTPLSPEQFRTMASSLYIDANRASMSDGLPTGPLHKYLPAKIATNSQPQQ